MIETERLILRPWVEADRAPFTEIMADPDVGFWLGGALSPADADTAFDRMRGFWAEHGYGQQAITRRSDGVLLGRVGCRRVPMEWKHPMSGEVEVGWLLARAAWGHGYATEAAAPVLTWGFDALNVPVIHSWTAAINHRSEAVMRRIGMTRATHLDFDHPDLSVADPLRRHVVYVAARPTEASSARS